MNIFKRKNELVVQEQKPQTIQVRDLKEYLVKDFEQIRLDQITISNLEDRIEKLEEIEMKYKATLITLEEFDSRVAREKEEVLKAKEKNEELRGKIKVLEEEKNNCIIREKIAIDKINNVKETILTEYKEKLITEIQNIKGTLSKKRVCEVIKDTE